MNTQTVETQDTTPHEDNLAQRIAIAIADAVKPFLGNPAHQFQIATALGEDPSTFSKVLTGKNSNATRPLRWIEYWNRTQDRKIMLGFDGTTVRVSPKKATAPASAK